MKRKSKHRCPIRSTYRSDSKYLLKTRPSPNLCRSRERWYPSLPTKMPERSSSSSCDNCLQLMVCQLRRIIVVPSAKPADSTTIWTTWDRRRPCSKIEMTWEDSNSRNWSLQVLRLPASLRTIATLRRKRRPRISASPPCRGSSRTPQRSPDPKELQDSSRQSRPSQVWAVIQTRQLLFLVTRSAMSNRTRCSLQTVTSTQRARPQINHNKIYNRKLWEIGWCRTTSV